mmetsp:Transcript_103462/g.289837  ORF Transcript_103462/g.289837 Transcript_103462/m.289837 type:complete len:341 (-) Transcript_103462:920-1942(-)
MLLAPNLDVVRHLAAVFPRALGILVGDLLQLCHEEAVHVVHMRVVPPGKCQRWMESFLAVLRQALDAKVHRTREGDQLDRPCPQSMVDHSLVLFDGDRARGVHDVASGFGARIHHVDRYCKQLLLQPAVLLEVFRAPLHLHGGVARDDPRARARGVEEDAVQLRHHTHELLPVHASGDDIRQPEAVAVRDEGLAPLLAQIVGEKGPGVLHQLTDVSRLTAGRSSHVENCFVLLWRKCHYRDERGCALDHVMPAQVLRGGADGNLRIVDLEPDLRPWPDGVHLHLPRVEGLHERGPPGFEGIGPDGKRSGLLVRFEELHGLLGAEHPQKVLRQLLGIAEVR